MTAIPPGWRDLAQSAMSAARRAQGRHQSARKREKGRIRGAAVDAHGRLRLDIMSSNAERARGVGAAVHAVSGEICNQCGGPGDPVQLAGTGSRTTRCEECRTTADEVLPRPAWRRERDAGRETPNPNSGLYDHRSMPVIEDVLSDDNLAALMEGRDVGSGWPRSDGDDRLDEFVGGIHGLPYWLMQGGDGWCALIRAFFTLVLPMQCEGQTRPVRIIKTAKSYRGNWREPELAITACNFDDYRWGIAALVIEHSRRTCCDCGLPQAGVAGVSEGPGRRCSCREERGATTVARTLPRKTGACSRPGTASSPPQSRNGGR